jgi:hypothetical protein
VRRRLHGAALALAVVGAAACGKKGPPLPPLRPVPHAVADFAIDRLDAVVTLSFTLPSTNTDGTSPVALERVDVYGLTDAADAPAPTPARLLESANLIGSLATRVAGTEPVPGSSGVPGPAPGERATFVDRLTAPAAGAVRYYAVVGVAGRRRGPASPIIPVSLGGGPTPPQGVAVDYDEQTYTVSWQSGGANEHYLVYQASSAGAEATPVSPEALSQTRFTGPTELGRERCFVVRAVYVTGRASVRGAASVPACASFADRFPPPVPAGLVAVASDGGVDLVWSAVEAADLSGYVVLRGDGPDGTLQRLTPDPIAATQFRDTSAQSGVTYVYAVVSVDKAAPPNASAPSNRQVVTAR